MGNETGGNRPDVADLRFADLDPPGRTIQPGTGIQDNGYNDDQVPPAVHHNWLFQKHFRSAEWYSDAIIREFDCLATAIANVDDGDTFRLRGPYPFDQASGLGAVAGLITDVEQLFVIVAEDLIAYPNQPIVDGATVANWTVSPWTGPPVGLAGNGQYVIAYGSTDRFLYILDPATGATVASQDQSGYPTAPAIVAAGRESIFASRGTGELRFFRYEWTPGLPTINETIVVTPADVTALYVDRQGGSLGSQRLYVGMADGTLRRYDAPDTGAITQIWEIQIPGGGTQINSITSDGETVYLGTEIYNPAASSDPFPSKVPANVLAIDAESGDVLGRALRGSADCVSVVADHAHLWISLADDAHAKLSKATLLSLQSGGDLQWEDTDGYHAVGYSPATGEIRRFATDERGDLSQSGFFKNEKGLVASQGVIGGKLAAPVVEHEHTPIIVGHGQNAAAVIRETALTIPGPTGLTLYLTLGATLRPGIYIVEWAYRWFVDGGSNNNVLQTIITQDGPAVLTESVDIVATKTSQGGEIDYRSGFFFASFDVAAAHTWTIQFAKLGNDDASLLSGKLSVRRWE